MTGTTLAWQPHIHVLLCFALIAAVSALTWLVYRRMRSRLPARRARILIVPRILIPAMFILALLDPVLNTVRSIKTRNNILFLVDVSSSMDVEDAKGVGTRLEKARRLLGEIEKRLPPSFTATTMSFDTRLHGPPAEFPPATAGAASGAIRGTDLAGCLLELSERSDISAHAAIVLLTDGGDESVRPSALPAAPLNIIAFGTDASARSDLEIADVNYPPSAEKDVTFEIAADIAASGFKPDTGLSDVKVMLEEQTGDGWRKKDETSIDLSNNRARAKFLVSCPSAGFHRFRLSVPQMGAESSLLNNSRTFGIDIRRKSLHVLYFTRQLGSELKMIRAELASDPGIAFTALYRTIGEKFTVQGERMPGDEALDAGFPSSAEVLGLFECVIIGSFPRDQWTDAQMKALVQYVADGGAAIFLGGENSFDSGNYSGTPMAGLFPWLLTGENTPLQRGTFPVSIPVASANNEILAGIPAILFRQGQPHIESINRTGPLKPGATSLMDARLDDKPVCLIGVHKFGRGMVMAVASNTFWKWARQSSDMKECYGLFWRQAVRNLAGMSEGGGILSVKWDKEFYRPGERAFAEIRLAGERGRHELDIAASLTFEENTQRLPVEPAHEGPNAFSVNMVFKKRGVYNFAVFAKQNNNILESYEKNISVAPFLEEGSRINADSNFLAGLAQEGGGIFLAEPDGEKIVEHLVETHSARNVVSQSSIVYDNWYFIAVFLAVVAAELSLRRAFNLF